MISSYIDPPGGSWSGSCLIHSSTIDGTGVSPFSSATISAINQVAFNPIPSSSGQVGAYLLAYDGANSYVYYTSDVLAQPVSWIQGASVSGQYKTIRLTKTPGSIRIYSPSNGGNHVEAYSNDYGASWTTVTVGASPGSTAGADTQTQYGGTVAYATVSGGQVKKATTIGGSYSNAGAALTDIAYVIVPWYRWSSDSTQNSGSSPDYLIGLSALSGGGSLFRDDGSGSRTDITPSVSGTKALFTSPNFATMWKSQRMAVVGNISGTPHVFTSVNAGTAFTDRGAITGASFIIIRRRATTPGQLYINAGANIKYMPNAFTNSTILTKSTPLATVSGQDIYG